MIDPFTEMHIDYDSPENSDVMASGTVDGWELLIVVVPTATLPCSTVPEVIPMVFIDRVVVAVEADYLNTRMDEAYPLACREAAAEGWLEQPANGQISPRLAEKISQHALAEAASLGQEFIQAMGPSRGSQKDHQ